MRFYTNIQYRNNDILVREIDGDDRLKYRDSFQPTLYLSHNKKLKLNEVDYKTPTGIRVAPIKPGSISDCRKFIERYKNVDKFDVYGYTQWGHQFISEEYKLNSYDLSKVRVCTIDIEVECEHGFPSVEDVKEKINAITIKDSQTNEVYALGTGDFVTDRDDVHYINCGDENVLLDKFIELWQVLEPDVITGWNCKLYDIPYLVRRISYLKGEKVIKALSPWGVVNESNVTIMGREHLVYTLFGIAILDFMDLYKKFTYVNQESYKLDHIAYVELGEKKLDYSEYGTFHWFYKSDYQKFIEYNIKDVELVERLENKMKLIELAMTIAYEAGVNYEDVFSPVKTWDSLIYNHLKKQDIVIPPRSTEKKIGEYEGAYVKEPEVGMHDWVVSFDLNSLYPHLIMQYNISPETIRKDISQFSTTIDQLVTGEVSIPKIENTCMAANGVYYSTEKQGFLPELMQKMYDDRVIAKTKMIECQKELELLKNGKGRNELLAEISKYENIQMAKKISLNSAYGALGNNWFRYFDVMMAESITLSGQLSIRWVEDRLNVYFNNLLSTENKDYVVAVDTDSVYITMGTLVDKFMDNSLDRSDIVNSIDSFCEDRVIVYINKWYRELSGYMGAYQQKMVMDREVISDRGVWTAKKRYVLNVCDSEGVRYEEPKLKIMGIECVRSSTPEVCRDRIRETLKLVMTEDENVIIDYIDNFRDEFRELLVNEVSFPRSVNHMNKYYDSVHRYKKGTPIHVKGCLLFNNLVKSKKLETKYPLINNGEKIKFVYLKEPNPLGEKVIGFVDTFPPEFGLDKYVDHDTQFDKSYLDPIKIVLDAIGWNHERIGTLEGFFG